jgi:hypothetical protein
VRVFRSSAIRVMQMWQVGRDTVRRSRLELAARGDGDRLGPVAWLVRVFRSSAIRVMQMWQVGRDTVRRTSSWPPDGRRRPTGPSCLARTRQGRADRQACRRAFLPARHGFGPAVCAGVRRPQGCLDAAATRRGRLWWERQRRGVLSRSGVAMYLPLLLELIRWRRRWAAGAAVVRQLVAVARPARPVRPRRRHRRGPPPWPGHRGP